MIIMNKKNITMNKKLKELFNLAEQLGIDKEVKEIVNRRFIDEFDMTQYGFEIYCNKFFKPVGIFVDDRVVIAKNEICEKMSPTDGQKFCNIYYLNGYKCDVFPIDLDLVDRFHQLNQALISIGGDPLREESYLAFNPEDKTFWDVNFKTGEKKQHQSDEKISIRPTMWIK